MSFGVVNPNLTLVQERFEPQGAVRIHHRLTPVDSRGTSSPSSSNSGYGAGLSQPRSGVPRFFMQSRRSVLESALFSGREKVRFSSGYFWPLSASLPRTAHLSYEIGVSTAAKAGRRSSECMMRTQSRSLPARATLQSSLKRWAGHTRARRNSAPANIPNYLTLTLADRSSDRR